MAGRRVLWVVKGLGPGGAERLLVSLAQSHDPERVTLACAYLLPWKNHLVAELRAAGVHVVCLEGGRVVMPGWAIRLRRLVRSWAPDFVHFHSPVVAGVGGPALAGLRPKPATVVTEHNAWQTYGPPTRMLNALAYPRHAAHLAVSDDARESIPRRWRPDVEVLVHGVGLDAVRAEGTRRDEMRAALGIDDREVVVGTVANYTDQKDYPTLLRAARTVLDADAGVRFLVVGQGPDRTREAIERLHAELGLGDGVRLLGYRRDAHAVLAACDIFCLSSRYEGYPVALMEALALGLPVVATAVGGIADAVRDGVEGRLVAPGEPAALAAALLAVAADPNRRTAMGHASRARSALFDIRRAARRLEELYAGSVS
jgi:glycosyltransferase involved in cell wall biosynthesis